MTTRMLPDVGEPDLSDRAATAAKRAAGHLLGLQSDAGWWKGELATNVTMEAEDLFLRHVLGILDDRTLEETARWIRSQQRADGSWATFFAGPPDLSTTLEAYVALRLAGDPVTAPHMLSAARLVIAGGGLERSRVFTRMWLALLGRWSWDELPSLPPEMIFLPRWFPLNVYDFACWARQTIVPLTVVGTLRPRRDVDFDLAELRTGARRPELDRRRGVPAAFQLLDRLLHAYARRPLGALRRLALRRAGTWIAARQEADGSWGGIQPPWVYSVLALRALGHPLDGRLLRDAIAGLDRFTVHEDTPAGRVRRLEACQSPIWDTALAVIALLDAGVPATDPAVRRAADWLLAEEVRIRGDWAVRRTRLAPGGWAFEFDNDVYPDVDDTAEVALALRRVRTDPEAAAAVRRGLDWMVGMRSSDGGWAAFDVDNTRRLATMLPFCDFGEVIDPPSADVTAHAVEALAAVGLAGSAPARDGVAWLLRSQEPGGSWFGRWGVNHVYGTGAVVPALVAAGVPVSSAPVRRAVRWLESVQHPSGGWGEDLRSYRDPTWIGRGTPTASQTAWALLALLAAGERDSDAASRGIAWLAATQRPDGTWDEPEYTGTGFPGDFSINYGLYRLVFPISALGRYLRGGSP